MQITDLGRSAILALGILGLGPARAAGTYVKLDYPASAALNELKVAVTYTLWIPEDVKTLRGIIVHQHGAARRKLFSGHSQILL